MRFEFGFGPTPMPRPVDPGMPFRMLVLGDFSGGSTRGRGAPSRGSIPLRIDCDNFESVFSRLAPGASVSDPQDPARRLALRFETLEDFHPDRLIHQVPTLARLDHLRRRLLDPATSGAAAEEVQMAWPGLKPPSGPGSPPAEQKGESTQDTLERLLGAGGGARAGGTTAAPRDFIGHLVREAGKASAAPGLHPEHGPMVAALDLEMTAQLRAVMHAQPLRDLEAIWRSLDFLIRNVGTDESLEVWLLDMTKEELTTDLSVGRVPQEVALYRILGEPTTGVPGAAGWAVMVGIYSFNPADSADIQLLRQLAVLGAATQTSFIGGAKLAADEVTSGAWAAGVMRLTEWAELRRSAAAGYVGLAWPGFLLRLPYGKRTDAIESFAFEEMRDVADSAFHLWGNPSVICACLLGQSFSENGWGFSPGDVSEVTGLPVHSYRDGDEPVMTPCGGVWLSEGHAEALLGVGIMPVLSIRGRDAVRLVRFQSVREPLAPLAGRWG